MVIVWKGAASLNLDGWNAGQIAGCIFGVSFGVMALVVIFFLPYVHRKLIMDDWTMKWYHIPLGPLLLWRLLPRACNAGGSRGRVKASTIADMEHHKAEMDTRAGMTEIDDKTAATLNTISLSEFEREDAGPWYSPKNLQKTIVDAFMHGVRKDVIAEQNKASILAGDIQDMHIRAAHFDNKTEHLYSFLQVLTAATASFAHGSNDVSNAIGPLATTFLIWKTGRVSSEVPVPVWVLCYGGTAIVIGLWTYGYNIMRNLGNRLTLHSPSRGFSIELGSATTVVMATRLSLPISTTQCIVGATMGVAFCNGDWKALNWRMVTWCYAGWIITLPVAGTIAGCLMGIIINAPTWVPSN
ncbi:Na+/Pi symporter [Rhizina undulata]